MKNENWLVTMSAAAWFGVSVETLRHWRRWQGFPMDAFRRTGIDCEWDVTRVAVWLKARPVSTRGRPAKWRAKLDAHAI